MLTGNWNIDQRKVIASQMVGLPKISLVYIIIKSRNPSILVFILVFKLRTEFPGKCVLVGETSVKGKSSLQITPCLFSSSPQKLGGDSLFSCRIFPFFCFVVPKLLEERTRHICHTTVFKTDSCSVIQNQKRNHLFLITLLCPPLHRCRLPVGYS